MTEQGGVSYMDGILRISLMGGQARAFLVESTHTVEHARRVHHLSHTATAALGAHAHGHGRAGRDAEG